ncbi:MAG TPA: endonuclease/exonuclease/phosphatase family protein [Pyrinomonadaceae bacterium]|nr:endonuclease/exonuclease/phosphatase family protein [Pyrinomonadaceae bacterium]
MKFALAILFGSSLLAAFSIRPKAERIARPEAISNNNDQNEKRLRLLSWNIGNGDLESETRAHTQDLPEVANVILRNDPDAVALQELSGEEQLEFLLTQLGDRYRGFVNNGGSGDRFEALLVRVEPVAADHGAGNVAFDNVPTGGRFSAAATFRLHKDWPEIVLLSVHADAFNAAARRAFVGEVVDWSRRRGNNKIVFIAGDFNLEVGTRNRNNLFTNDAKHDSESYAYLLKYFADLGRAAGQTSLNERRIDYLFGPPARISLRHAEVLRDAAVGHMDHWPLLVEVGL